MTGFDWSSLAVVSGASAGALALVQTAAFRIGRRIGRYNVVDVSWGLGLVVVALIAALAGAGAGEPTRAWLLCALVAVWGLRLSWHLHTKSAGKDEDPRYTAMLGDAGPATVIRKVFLTQGLAQWFVSLPLQVSAVAGPTTGAWSAAAWLGGALWLLGVVFEAVGDHQLRAFKANPANRGKIMASGLWAWTRHPNYFGDACVWWGLWLIAASAWPGVLTALSPVVMTYFLVFATGARLLERSMSQRPGYPEYQRSTSYFLPRPPGGKP
ncbi:DUF1295 domain-containing protein [Tomitella biformata]|uniref:DUF1295 domain-containing protein n=1 Tax=Tomitella biformata TaxID=630403 RepID=UPI000465C1D8|nr:DUF1295 domain-containing protein [Tomitella biformata]